MTSTVSETPGNLTIHVIAPRTVGADKVKYLVSPATYKYETAAPTVAVLVTPDLYELRDDVTYKQINYKYQLSNKITQQVLKLTGYCADFGSDLKSARAAGTIYVKIPGLSPFQMTNNHGSYTAINLSLSNDVVTNLRGLEMPIYMSDSLEEIRVEVFQDPPTVTNGSMPDLSPVPCTSLSKLTLYFKYDYTSL